MKNTLDNKIEFIFLGTASSLGTPIIGLNHPVCKSLDSRDKRLRSSLLIRYNSMEICIDCGPDFRQQMLREEVLALKAIFFTHNHADHVGGLDDVRPFNFLHNYIMPLFAEDYVLEAIKKRYDYCFEIPKYPGAPDFSLQPIIPNEEILYNGLKIKPLRIIHGDLPILGYKIGKLAYLTDVKAIPEETMTELLNLDYLIISTLRKERTHHSQYILPEALEIIEQLKPKTTYLTHLGIDIGLHAETEQELPPNVKLAYDGLRLTLTYTS